MNQEELIRYITDKIVEKFNPRRIILFGSRACGEAREDSDYDLFIEMETEKRQAERAIKVDELFGLHSWSMDVFVFTPQEIAALRSAKRSFLAVIEQEGRLLYERPAIKACLSA